jgi:hypothetical protein
MLLTDLAMLKTIWDRCNSTVPISIPKRIIAVLFASFYTLAFVMSPYWSLIPSKVGAILFLAIIIGFGAFWSYLSAADIKISVGVMTLLWLGVLLGGMAILNYGPLTSVIPWRGDESTFIIRTRDLISRLPVKFALLAPFICVRKEITLDDFNKCLARSLFNHSVLPKRAL